MDISNFNSGCVVVFFDFVQFSLKLTADLYWHDIGLQSHCLNSCVRAWCVSRWGG